MKHWIALTGLFISQTALASQILTLEDGRQVQLEDDFTWHYVLQTEQVPPPSSIQPSHASTSMAYPAQVNTSIQAIPAIQQHVGGLITIGSNKPTLQLSDSGVSILLDAAQYHDGELHIPTAITNQQTSDSIIQVQVLVTIFDLQGKELAKETITVWQSIKRMAETYLRPKQAAEGRTISIAIPAARQYRISAEIVSVSSR